jgi:putative ABC transport system permease protein
LLRNYTAAALRNLWRNRLVAALNLFGLAVGFAAVLIIALYLRYESHYDRIFPGYENIYRVSATIYSPNGEYMRTEFAGSNVLAWLAEELPEMELGARIDQQWHTVGTDTFEVNDQIYEADPEFFRLFRIRAVAGDLEHALDAPDAIAISRATARKFFGSDAPLGETLKFERAQAFRVTAVFEDLPANTHFNFRMVTSARNPNGPFTFAATIPSNDVRMVPAHSYLRLKAGSDLERVRKVVAGIVAQHSQRRPGSYELNLMPITDIHLAPEGRSQMKPRGNPPALRALVVVGALILVIAVLNFVNLTTARAAERGVEVAVRKLAGARRRDLALQFLGESMLQVFLAMLLAVSMAELALPHFALLLEIDTELYALPEIHFDYWSDPAVGGALLGLTLFVGIIAGAWPAFVLSSFRPVTALKGLSLGGRAGARVRAVLVILQFALLIWLLFATTVVYRQTSFALNNALRIDVDQVVIYNLWSDFSRPERPAPAFVDAARAVPGVLDITASGSAPTNISMLILVFNHAGKETTPIEIVTVDYNFFDFFGVKLLAGRKLEAGRGTDRLEGNDQPGVGIVINEAASRVLGFTDPARAIGAAITPSYWPPGQDRPARFEVVGVVRDFPNDTLRQAIRPSLYYVYERDLAWISIRIAARNVPETLAGLRAAWKQHGQPRAQAGWFLDSYYREKYADVILQKRALTIFCGCAALLGALGLFALSLYTVQRRTREIGIRRAMGADTSALMRMLLWGFTKPVLWASLIAWPVALWAMKQWLEGFAYRVDIGWWWLPVATLAALAIALVTVGAHSHAVARARPAAALRHE